MVTGEPVDPEGAGEGVAMAHVRAQVPIAAPVEEVVDVVAGERNEPAHDPRIVRAEKLRDGPVGQRSRSLARPRGTGAGGTTTVDVRALVGSRWARRNWLGLRPHLESTRR